MSSLTSATYFARAFSMKIVFEEKGRFVLKECWNVNAVFRRSICLSFPAYALFLPLQSTTLSFAIAKKNQDFKHFQAFIIQRFIFFFKISTETRRNPLLFSAVRFQMSPHTQRKSIKKKLMNFVKRKVLCITAIPHKTYPAPA